MSNLGKDALSALAREGDSVHLTTGRIVELDHPVIDGVDDISDLVSRLRFAIKDGRIWLDTERVLMIHLSTMTSLRKELIDTLGMEEAQGFLTRMGYASGTRDAALAKKLRPRHSTRDAYLIGPQLRILQGVSRSVPATLEIDVSTGHFFSDFIVKESFEADAHISTMGMSDVSTCWLQTGYACGFSSTFMGKAIIHQEVECRSTGGRYCRFVGKPADEWDAGDDLQLILEPDFDKFGKRKSTISTGNGIQPVSSPVMDCKTEDQDTDKMVGASSAFIATTHLISKVGKTSATVLFLGETGVGKERFAHSLHSISKRAHKPFITLNCAAIPENLIEAELFGVEKGAYTGAIDSRPGKFERADGGSLFLDEVGNLSRPAQIKLLRAIQEREFERIGGTKVLKADVRIIAATNVDLEEAVKRNEFRGDLFYRLNIFPVNIPPLRERRGDIPLLMEYFLNKYARMHEKDISEYTVQAVDALYDYSYPGNIRELENMVERAVILVDDGQMIDSIHLFSPSHAGDTLLKLDRSGALYAKADRSEPENDPLLLLDTVISSKCSLSDLEEGILNEAIKRCEGNIAQAARLLGLTRPQMAYRLKKLSPVVIEHSITNN